MSPTAQMETDRRSVGDLLKELRNETTVLLRQEVALAKTEMQEKASKAAKNAATLAAGALVGYAGLIFVLLGVSFLVARGLIEAGVAVESATWMGPLIVGVAVALIGLAMVMKAKKSLKATSPVPERTIRTLKADKEWAREQATRGMP